MAIRWKGLIAPTEVPTGDGRMFAAGKLTSRPMPIPLMVRFGSGGHDGATVVGTVNRIYDGPGGYWGEGEFLDPVMVPEVPKAVYMISKKVMGPSVDLDRDFTVNAVKHPLRPEKKAGLFSEYNVIGVTLVPMPAFHQVHMAVENGDAPEANGEQAPMKLMVDSPHDKALLASVMPDIDTSSWTRFDVNGDAWKQWPIAPRDYKFDADDAVKRIAYWAGIGSEEPNLDAYASAFLWRNGNQAGDSLAQDSFRLPLADVINGELYLIYHAAYAAAALLSGAHGGLPNIPEQDRSAMVPVIAEIYAALAQAFNDPNLVSPFESDIRRQQASIDGEEDCGCTPRFDAEEGQVEVQLNNVTTTSASGANVIRLDGYSAPVANVTITFAPAMPPADVRKSVVEESKPYGDNGCHFNEDGFCAVCGY